MLEMEKQAEHKGAPQTKKTFIGRLLDRSSEKYMAQGDKCYSRGKYPDALRHYLDAKKKGHQLDYEHVVRCGDIYRKEGKPAFAIDYYNNAKDMPGSDKPRLEVKIAKSYIWLANGYADKHEPEMRKRSIIRASEHYSIALNAEKTAGEIEKRGALYFAMLHRKRGEISMKLGDLEGAVSDGKAALGLLSDSSMNEEKVRAEPAETRRERIRGHIFLAKAHEKHGMFLDALRSAEKADLIADKEDSALKAMCARLHALVGNMEKANEILGNIAGKVGETSYDVEFTLAKLSLLKIREYEGMLKNHEGRGAEKKIREDIEAESKAALRHSQDALRTLCAGERMASGLGSRKKSHYYSPSFDFFGMDTLARGYALRKGKEKAQVPFAEAYLEFVEAVKEGRHIELQKAA